MTRRRPCDGCGANRKRWQRLCDTCFAALPGDVRTGLIAAHRERRMADWRAFVRRARALLTSGLPPRTSAEATYARTNAMLGERDA